MTETVLQKQRKNFIQISGWYKNIFTGSIHWTWKELLEKLGAIHAPIQVNGKISIDFNGIRTEPLTLPTLSQKGTHFPVYQYSDIMVKIQIERQTLFSFEKPQFLHIVAKPP